MVRLSAFGAMSLAAVLSACGPQPSAKGEDAKTEARVSGGFTGELTTRLNNMSAILDTVQDEAGAEAVKPQLEAEGAALEALIDAEEQKPGGEMKLLGLVTDKGFRDATVRFMKASERVSKLDPRAAAAIEEATKNLPIG